MKFKLNKTNFLLFLILALLLLSPAGNVATTTRTGRPLQIFEVTSSHLLSIRRENLAAILNHPSARDLPVYIISIVGDYRKGKSFMLNILLQSARETAAGLPATDWITSNGTFFTPATGFSSRGGRTRDTKGILMWSEPILFTHPATGRQVALLFMDTQGMFDHATSQQVNTQLFALSTLTSSVQVYNQMGSLSEYDIDHLATFSRYALAALQHSQDVNNPGVENPAAAKFDRLVVLLRDWRFPQDLAYGPVGGAELINELLDQNLDGSGSGETIEELSQTRQILRSAFKTIDCHLLPEPGEKIKRYTSNGTSSYAVEANPDFLRHTADFVSSLLDPSVMPSAGGATGSQLLSKLSDYWSISESDKLGTPRSLVDLMIQQADDAAVARARQLFSLTEPNNEALKNIPYRSELAAKLDTRVSEIMRETGNRPVVGNVLTQLSDKVKERYDTIQDAERARREAERKQREAEEREAELRRQQEELRRQQEERDRQWRRQQEELRWQREREARLRREWEEARRRNSNNCTIL